MVQLKRNLLSVALASATLMLAHNAHAQGADNPAAQDQAAQDQAAQPDARKDEATKLDTVQVRGIRRGIQKSIDAKKNSTSIVEAVSAEDIGKLPDVSIAESLARLPGLAAQRVGGRAQVISVRGLSPDFSTTLLNGREMVSTGDNRSVEFDQYPSELLSGVVVYKTPDAGLVGQGLSGTIDMQTVRPLNFSDSAFVVGLRGTHNSLGSAANASGDGNRFNASYIGQFADRTLGVSFGYAHSDTPIQENQVGLYEPWFQNPSATVPDPVTGLPQPNPNHRPGINEGVWMTDGIKALRRTGYLKRDGLMGTLEYKPNDVWHSTLDMFYSKARQEDTANQFESHLFYNGSYPCNPSCQWTNPTVDGSGTLTGGTVTNVYPLVRGMYNNREDKIRAIGWNNLFNIGGVKLVADVGWSKANRDELSLENNTQLLPGPQYDTLNLQLHSDDFSQINPGLNYSDPNSLYVTNTIYGSGYGKVPRVADELKTYKVTANFPGSDAGWFSSYDVGLNYDDRTKEKHQPEGNINLGAQGPTTIPSDLQYGLVDLGFAGVGFVPSWDVPGVVSRFMVFQPNENASYLVSKAWTVDEKIGSGWFKANIDTVWGSVPVRGNIGVQVQHVDQSSSANVFDGAAPAGQQIVPYTDGKTYTDVLPSLNLAWEFPSEQYLRFALAKQVARPRVDQMRASFDFGVDTATGKPGASGGNPQLDPWKANALDISYEKYFDNKGYLAAAVFYKDLQTYIYTQSFDNYDFSQWVAGYVPPLNSPPAQTTGTFSKPANGKGGNMKGLELTASLPLDVFSSTLDGFGVIASATFTDSSITILADPDQQSSVGSAPIPLPGLSKRVYNFTAYYENNGFEARINNRRRSDFVGEIGNFNGNRTLRYVVGENVTDAQVSYTFSNDSSFRGLTLLLQANNLTNEAYRTYAGTKDRPLEYIEWGRTYLLGLSYKF